MPGIIEQFKNKLKNNIFPVTLTKAVYTEDNKRLDNIIGDTTKLPSSDKGICENISGLSSDLTEIVSSLGTCGTTTLTIPNNWKTLEIQVFVNGTERIITLPLRRGFITTNHTYSLRNGYYVTSTNCIYVNASVTTDANMELKISVSQVQFGADNVTTSSSFGVIYDIL